jgi:hypothetical protein
MMAFFQTLTIFSSLFLITIAELSNDIDVYWLEHSINTNKFKEIGTLNIRTIRQNQNTAHYQTHNSANDLLHESDQPKSNNIQHSTLVKSNLIDESTKQDIIKALQFSENSFYRLRLCKKVPQQSCDISSFIYLKDIVNANFKFNLTVNTDINNRLNSISIKTHKSQNHIPIDDLEYLSLYASVQNIRTAQTPDTEAYLDKIRKEQEQKEKGAQGGNESFWSKYWMYIVPFLVVMFLMNLVNPEGAGQA